MNISLKKMGLNDEESIQDSADILKVKVASRLNSLRRKKQHYPKIDVAKIISASKAQISFEDFMKKKAPQNKPSKKKEASGKKIMIMKPKTTAKSKNKDTLKVKNT